MNRSIRQGTRLPLLTVSIGLAYLNDFDFTTKNVPLQRIFVETIDASANTSDFRMGP